MHLENPCPVRYLNNSEQKESGQSRNFSELSASVPKAGIEPAHPRIHDFESCASTSSATLANTCTVFDRPIARLSRASRDLPVPPLWLSHAQFSAGLSRASSTLVLAKVGLPRWNRGLPVPPCLPAGRHFGYRGCKYGQSLNFYQPRKYA